MSSSRRGAVNRSCPDSARTGAFAIPIAALGYGPLQSVFDPYTADPTAREPLVLRLMALDRVPSVYLGRPCYHGLAADPRCTPALWTDARYSEVVVASMAAATRRLLSLTGHTEIVWLGFTKTAIRQE